MTTSDTLLNRNEMWQHTSATFQNLLETNIPSYRGNRGTGSMSRPPRPVEETAYLISVATDTPGSCWSKVHVHAEKKYLLHMIRVQGDPAADATVVGATLPKLKDARAE